MDLFSSRIKKLETLQVGDVVHDRKSSVLNKVLAVLAPGIYLLSQSNDYTRVDKNLYDVPDMIEDNCIKVEGDRLAKLEEKYNVKKD